MVMRLWFTSLLLLLVPTAVMAQQDIRLLVRIDDMGFSHAANLACIEAYTQGIARSVEVMVPGPWFEEAVDLLAQHPGLDVGVHLTLTSEWSHLKWRPLTSCPSLTNAEGYFYPMIWKNDNFAAGNFLIEAPWQIDEIEAELRAQIELALDKIPRISHLTHHMGCMHLSDETRELLNKLAVEYGLDIFPDEQGVKRTPRWSGSQFTAKQKEERFLQMLDDLSGGSWMTVEHPGYDVPELAEVGHTGYENVAEDRAGVTHTLTSRRVQRRIAKRGISLIDYRDLIQGQ